MQFEFIKIIREEMLVTLMLKRPDKRNAMHAEMVREVLKALTAIAADETVHVLLIAGEGDHFCAGADIQHMETMAQASYEQNYEDAALLASLMYQLYSFPKPTIVLAHGATLGGGLGLLAACDIALASKDAIFGFSEVKIGITPSTISPYIISAIGQRAARYYFLTGTRFGASEAAHIGLVHQITENDALYRTGHALAKTLLLNSPHAMTAAKQLIQQVLGEALTPELGMKTAAHLAHIRVSSQAKEGLNAFMEKRAPLWR